MTPFWILPAELHQFSRKSEMHRSILICVMYAGLLSPGVPHAHAQVDTVWTRSLSGINGGSLYQTESGDLLLAGGRDTSGVIVRYSADGDLLWERTYDAPPFAAVAETFDGGLIAAGAKPYVLRPWSGIDGYAHVTRIGAGGETKWTKVLNWDFSDGLDMIIAASDGGFISAGYHGCPGSSSSPCGGSSGTYHVVKLDDTGHVVIEHASNILYAQVGFVDETPEGHVLAFGQHFSQYHGGDCLFMARYAPGEARVCIRNEIGMLAVTRTSDGNYLLAQSGLDREQDLFGFWFLKVTPSGTVIWTKFSEHKGVISALAETSTGGFIAVGYTDLVRVSESDLLIIELDEEGNILSSEQIDFGGDERAGAVEVLDGDDFVISGTRGIYGRERFLARFTASSGTSVEELPPTSGIGLAMRSAPNPFSNATSLSFNLAQSAPVFLSIYNVAGQRVRVLIDGQRLAPGVHRQEWDGLTDSGRPAPNGIYLARLDIADVSESIKLVLIR